MKSNLPDSLQPTPADLARDAELAREADAILGGIRNRTGMGVRTDQDGYSSTTFGADGSIVSRIVNGVPQQSAAEEAVARAKSAANADIVRLEGYIARLTAKRDEISGFEPDGSPKYVRGEVERASLDGQIRSLSLVRVNQLRLNERRWRNDAAPAVRRAESAQEIIRELEAKGQVTRARSW